MNKSKNEKSSSGSALKVVLATLLICALLIGGGGYFLISKNIISLGQKQIENAYIDAGELSVKFQDEGKPRYIKCRVYVGYDKDNDDYKEQLTKNKQISVASEAINSYLRSKTYDYLNNLDNMDAIKSEIKDEVNKQLQSCKITDVRFYNYVLQ